MRCRNARRAIVEWGLGLLPAEAIGELRVHLDRCDACSTASVLEARLITALAGLREGPQPNVDVARRVGLELNATGRVDRMEVPYRQLGWISAATLAAGGLLLVGLIAVLPPVPQVVELIRGTADSLAATWDRLAPALLALALLPLRLLGTALSWISSSMPALGWIGPATRAVALFGCGLMSLTIAVVVMRDFSRGRPTLARKEHGS